MKKTLRRAQLISPWGVGAIVPFPGDESLMIAGLDMWRFGNNSEEFVIKDERLMNRLGVKELRIPPDYREISAGNQNARINIPVVRFPRWHYCPFCGTMEQLSLYSTKAKCNGYIWGHGRSCQNSKIKRYLVPERFVVVCPHGHIDDFPIMEWLHSDENHPVTKNCTIRRSTGGTSASLTGVFYECSCGAKRSMAGATLDGALEKIGYTCRGNMPWLGISESDGKTCGSNQVKVVQRGGTNVWFSDIYSSLFIPYNDLEAEKYITKVALDIADMVKTRRVNDDYDNSLIEMFAIMKKVDFLSLRKAVISIIEGKVVESDLEKVSEETYRFTEYNVLKKSCGSDNQNFHSKNYQIDQFDPIISNYFNSISLIPKVMETRAFVGFSRLQPNDSLSVNEKKKMLRINSENGDWLPAIQVYGEGIFFEFSTNNLKNWASSPSVKKRIAILNSNYNSVIERRQGKIGNLNPEYVLIHTFAHLIINQLSYECGYGSSSLRERIYCDKVDNEHEMYGVLIYTASGDSEGSLGGLVRQGKPGKIESIVISALKNAEWCSSDPICIQSTGQGPDNCNISACHNCSLLPETCCENGNRLLDRGLVVGTLEDQSLSYFRINHGGI